jgi:hypothetical protein
MKLVMKNLSDLMMISLNGPPINDFDPTKSIDRWYFGGKSDTYNAIL